MYLMVGSMPSTFAWAAALSKSMNCCMTCAACLLATSTLAKPGASNCLVNSIVCIVRLSREKVRREEDQRTGMSDERTSERARNLREVAEHSVLQGFVARACRRVGLLKLWVRRDLATVDQYLHHMWPENYRKSKWSKNGRQTAFES